MHPTELLLGLFRFMISMIWLLGGRTGVRTSTGELQDWKFNVKLYFKNLPLKRGFVWTPPPAYAPDQVNLYKHKWTAYKQGFTHNKNYWKG